MEQKETKIDAVKEEAVKQPKTWDEAINELQGFIIRSKKEEAMKAEADKKTEI